MTEPTKKKDLRSYERTRAAFFVQRYETELRTAVRNHPEGNQAEIARRVADRLRMIREEIMGAVPQYRKPIAKDADGFAGEEIEAAMEFINDENPFG